MLRAFPFLLTLCLPSFVCAQTTVYEAGYFQGIIAQASLHSDPLIHHSPKGFSVSYARQTSGLKPWHAEYRFPYLGVKVRSVFSGEKRVGNLYSIMPFAKFLINKNERNRIYFNGELGAAYCTNPYERVKNNANEIIGTRLNFSVSASFFYERSVSKNWNAFLQGGYVHYSNANFRQPNGGLDVFFFQTGLNYKIKPNALQLSGGVKDSTVRMKTWSFNWIGALGWNTSLPYERKIFPGYHGIFYAGYRLTTKSSLLMGVDYFHDLSVKNKFSSIYELRGKPQPDFRRVGITVGHEFWFGKTTVLTQLGGYVYYRYYIPNPFYIRLGVKHYLNDHVSLSMTVKFHKAQSDIAEWGVGYRFYRKP